MTPSSEPSTPNNAQDELQSDVSPAPARPSSAAPTGQLRFFQALSFLLLVALVAGGGYAWYRQRHSQPVAILVDNRPAATVANYAVALKVIQQAELSAIGPAYAVQGDLRTTQAISYRHVGDTAAIDPEADAAAKLARLLHVTVEAAVITVNNHRAVALPDEATAQAALDEIQQHYVKLPPDDPVYGKPTFQEKVDVITARVPASLCKASADQAADLMLAPPKGKDYTVQPGDTGWRIARKSHITLSAFLEANAGRDLNHLKPGDIVNVAPTVPPLSVVVQKQITRTEQIIPGAPAGSGGERAITDVTTYINGARQPGSTPVDVVILQRAIPRRTIE